MIYHDENGIPFDAESLLHTFGRRVEMLASYAGLLHDADLVQDARPEVRVLIDSAMDLGEEWDEFSRAMRERHDLEYSELMELRKAMGLESAGAGSEQTA